MGELQSPRYNDKKKLYSATAAVIRHLELLTVDHLFCIVCHAQLFHQPHPPYEMTELQAAQQRIAELERLLDGVFQIIPIGVTEWAPDGRLVRASQGFFDLVGYAPEQIRTLDDWFSLVYPDPTLRANIIADWQQSPEQKLATREFPVTCRDGSVKLVAFKAGFLDNGHAVVSMSDISRRRLAEDAIRIFKTISDRALHGTAIADLAGTLIYVNETFARVHGYRPEDVLGLHFSVFHSKEQQAHALHIIEIALRDGHAEGVEVWHQHRDGTAFPMLMSVVVIEDSAGKPHYLAATAIDLTDHKRVELQLRATNDELERYFSSSLDLLCIATTDGRFVRLNPQWEKVLGYTTSELEGTPFLDLVHPDDRADTIATMATLAEQREVLNFENRYRRKDGSYRWIEWRSRPLGSMIYAAASDVTERRLAEEALRRSEATFRTIVQASPMGIYLYRLEDDDRLILTGANPAADQMLGIDNSRFIGLSIEEAFPKLRFTEVPERYRRAARFGEPWSTEEIVYEENDIAGAFEVHAFQISPGMTAVLFNNITERKRAEETRRKLQEQLNQAQKMESLGTLAGGVAHDFNNLLQVISGNIELLLLNRDERHPDRSRLETMAKSVDRASHLVRQLLLFGRKAEVMQQTIDLNQEIEDAVALLNRTIPRMISIDLRLSSATPAIHADPVQVEQVVLNLASNAADAMPDGGRLTIATEAIALDKEFADRLTVEPGPYVLMSVTDTGHGMTADVREQIFDPFFTTKEIGKGTGLGLASVYGIIKSHGGAILCYSEPGRGTTFKIYWPAQAAEGVVQPSALRTMDVPHGNEETILLVDDEADIRSLTAETLRQCRYRVLQAASGEEALSCFRKHGGTIDLVLLDLNMPGMGGYQCLRELLNIDPTVRVLVASGYSESGQDIELRNQGAAGFLGKPFQLHELLIAVRTIISGQPLH